MPDCRDWLSRMTTRTKRRMTARTMTKPRTICRMRIWKTTIKTLNSRMKGSWTKPSYSRNSLNSSTTWKESQNCNSIRMKNSILKSNSTSRSSMENIRTTNRKSIEILKYDNIKIIKNEKNVSFC